MAIELARPEAIVLIGTIGAGEEKFLNQYFSKQKNIYYIPTLLLNTKQ
jgi:hypothetical protein